jgi:hypothetical protein
MMRTFLILFAFHFSSLYPDALAQGLGPQQQLENADSLYLAGQLDSAKKEYSALIEGGYLDPHLYNMLASISLKQQNVPMAVVHLYKGLLLFPDSKLLSDNLTFIELREELPSGPRPFLPWGVYFFSTSTWASLFLASLAVVMLGLLVGTWFNSVALRRWMSALVLFAIGFGFASLFAAQWRHNLLSKEYGIVKINQTSVLVKPMPDAEVLMYMVPAQALEIMDWKDGWARVKNSDNVEGYVKEDQLLRAVHHNP